MIRHSLFWRFGLALIPLVAAAATASAATSFSNSLTGFTGNSTQSATQTALNAAGFNVTSTLGFTEDPPGTFIDPTIHFDSSGASFGQNLGDIGGRNFIRTNATDYANHSFVAEVTWVTANMQIQSAYFGLGSAEFGLFQIADWATEFSAVHQFLEVTDPENPTVYTLKNDNTVGIFDAGTAAPGLVTGTNRLRLTYNWFEKKADFAIDVNYAGGPFVADISSPTVNTLSLYGGDGWPVEPGRVYFGGDDGSVFKDFSVTLNSDSIVLGDFNSSGTITEADWAILRDNMHTNLSSLTFQQAYFLGDLTADKANNHADFVLFKSLYEDANGDGSFARMLAGVPEPSTFVLVLSLGLMTLPFQRGGNRS